MNFGQKMQKIQLPIYIQNFRIRNGVAATSDGDGAPAFVTALRRRPLSLNRLFLFLSLSIVRSVDVTVHRNPTGTEWIPLQFSVK